MNNFNDEVLQRLAQLEERLAHQDKLVEELSDQLAEQWKVNDRLRAKFTALTERFVALEETGAPAHENTRPPHW